MQDKFIERWHTPWDDSLEAQVARERDTNLDEAINYIVRRLELTKDDVVLDVCCGNGLLTKRIATHCKLVSGVDFSEILINTANSLSSADNLRYYLSDALRISKIFPGKSF